MISTMDVVLLYCDESLHPLSNLTCMSFPMRDSGGNIVVVGCAA